jgi:hypothetical protein
MPWERGKVTPYYSVVNHNQLWVVPALSGRSLLFACRTWRRSLTYAMCRAAGCSHREAVRMVRSKSTRV